MLGVQLIRLYENKKRKRAYHIQGLTDAQITKVVTALSTEPTLLTIAFESIESAIALEWIISKPAVVVPTSKPSPVAFRQKDIGRIRQQIVCQQARSLYFQALLSCFGTSEPDFVRLTAPSGISFICTIRIYTYATIAYRIPSR